MIKNHNYNSLVVPRVRFESDLELSAKCEALLYSYTELVDRVVMQKLRDQGSSPLAWTELERLMFGITTFEEILDEALPLVLATTSGNGALYAHDLNSRIIRCINKHNLIFFHETTCVCEAELRGSLADLLIRMLISSAQSHYHVLLEENFERFVAWDAHEWLVCPRHKVVEYVSAVVTAGTRNALYEDLVLAILLLLGFDSFPMFQVR